jgi:signal transduction histidine kinase
MRHTFLRRRAVLLGTASLCVARSALAAAPRGTPDEAKALALKAAALVQAQGDKAFAMIDDRAGPLVDRDLYITVIDRKGVMQASGFNKNLIGANTWDAEDPDGMKFVQEFWKTVASDNHQGWLTYKFVDPVTRKIARKRTFLIQVGDYVLTCGSYAGS